tara:strand:- start:8410 stop:8613 length:204 start_codon:yes stop_codon:yes gene_type:complete
MQDFRYDAPPMEEWSWDKIAYVGGQRAFDDNKTREECEYTDERERFQWNCGYSYKEWENESDISSMQ